MRDAAEESGVRIEMTERLIAFAIALAREGRQMRWVGLSPSDFLRLQDEQRRFNLAPSGDEMRFWGPDGEIRVTPLKGLPDNCIAQLRDPMLVPYETRIWHEARTGMGESLTHRDVILTKLSYEITPLQSVAVEVGS
jgi:hypothetical protein